MNKYNEQGNKHGRWIEQYRVINAFSIIQYENGIMQDEKAEFFNFDIELYSFGAIKNSSKNGMWTYMKLSHDSIYRLTFYL